MKTPETQNRATQQPHRTGPLVSVAGTLIMLSFLTAFFHRAVGDLGWGVTHGWRVVYRDLSFMAPFGWRQTSLPAEQNALTLRNTLRGVPTSRRADRIFVREAQRRFDAEEMAVRWQRLETQRMTPGDRLEPTPTDPFLQEHYRCSDVLRSRDGQVNVTCFDRDGRWIVSLRGEPRDIEDLSMIMRHLGLNGAR